MTSGIERLPEDVRRTLVKGKPPAWAEPMAATLTEERFSDPGWIFEPKLDGVRCLALRNGRAVQLLSRTHKRMNERYPELEEALAAQRTGDLIVDGEIVAFEGNRTSFSRLQRRMQIANREQARRSGVAVYLYLFDVLHADGYDLTGLPLRRRKSVLRSSLTFDDPLRLTPHRNAEGEAYYREACDKGWEGLIAKRADSTYQHRRSRDWLKFKCINEQEFVIGGYTDPKGSRQAFGALLIGYYNGGELRFAGKVGTGFDDRTLRTLGAKLGSIERERSPFGQTRIPKAGVHWVEPKLVGQVGFTEWTRDGQLRHPRFLGLRDDKRPSDVVRETPS
jgi:bifunctional non-homologous end joining protein LigD